METQRSKTVLDASSGEVWSGHPGTVWMIQAWHWAMAQEWINPFGAFERLEGNIYQRQAIWKRNHAKRHIFCQVAAIWMLVAGLLLAGAAALETVWLGLAVVGFVGFGILAAMSVCLLGAWVMLCSPEHNE